MSTLLFKLLIGHALADFVLQNDAMAQRKNRHAVPKHVVPWDYWMTAHCLIHAGAVWVITGSVMWATVEFFGHMTADILKCENVTNIHSDQAIHVGMKLLYAVFP
jgi:hypothetical protein